MPSPKTICSRAKVEQYAPGSRKVPIEPRRRSRLRALLAQGRSPGGRILCDHRFSPHTQPSRASGCKAADAAGTTPTAEEVGGLLGYPCCSPPCTEEDGSGGGLQLHDAERRRRREGEPAGRSGRHFGVTFSIMGGKLLALVRRLGAGGGVGHRRGVDGRCCPGSRARARVSSPSPQVCGRPSSVFHHGILPHGHLAHLRGRDRTLEPRAGRLGGWIPVLGLPLLVLRLLMIHPDGLAGELLSTSPSSPLPECCSGSVRERWPPGRSRRPWRMAAACWWYMVSGTVFRATIMPGTELPRHSLWVRCDAD